MSMSRTARGASVCSFHMKSLNSQRACNAATALRCASRAPTTAARWRPERHAQVVQRRVHLNVINGRALCLRRLSSEYAWGHVCVYLKVAEAFQARHGLASVSMPSSVHTHGVDIDGGEPVGFQATRVQSGHVVELSDKLHRHSGRRNVLVMWRRKREVQAARDRKGTPIAARTLLTMVTWCWCENMSEAESG